MQKKELRRLRALAHRLRPVVMMGSKGLTDSLLNEIDLALSHHELIKIKVSGADRLSRAAVTNAICEETGAELVQNIGHMSVLFRPDPDSAQPPR
jgi:RNA-binding protein